MRIAALDKDDAQRALLQRMLDAIGHESHGFPDGRSLLRTVRAPVQQGFDLLILDWDLPDCTGPELVQILRRDLQQTLPILFLAHRDTEAEVVQAFAVGADDYLVKSARVAELQARVNALLRRAYPVQRAAALTFGDYRFVAPTQTVEVHGVPVELKHREYELALFLFQNTGRLLSREYLRAAVWRSDSELPSRSLDTHISRLRNKLALRPENGYLLTAIYGMGYRLESVDAEVLTSPAPLLASLG